MQKLDAFSSNKLVFNEGEINTTLASTIYGSLWVLMGPYGSLEDKMILLSSIAKHFS